MAIGDFESLLERTPKVRELEDYASAWWDMRNAAQMIYAQLAFDATPDNYFLRRAVWDGAVITYARCFSSGRRATDILALVGELPPQLQKTHETLMRWRNQHTAHRVDPSFETIGVTLLWGNWGRNAPVARIRIITHPQPDVPDIETNFELLAGTLANNIWERYLYPLQQELLAEIGPTGVARLRRQTRLVEDKKWPKDVMPVTLDVGTVAPPNSTKPTPTPRKQSKKSHHRRLST